MREGARNAAIAAAFAVLLMVGAQAAPTVMTSVAPPEAGAFAPGTQVGLDTEQLAQATRALTVADTEHAPPLAVLAEMVAALGESNFRPVPNARGSGYCGVFQAHPSNIACGDTEGQARSFLRGGLGFQGGGAIHLAQRGGMSPGAIANAVEAGGAGAGFYDVHRPQAERIIAAWRQGDGSFPPADGLGLIAEADRMAQARQPYVWGGGHAAFSPDGPWDCSGAVSYLLHSQGLLDGAPLTSTGFMTWGTPGRGREWTVYANPIHVFLVIEAGPHAGDAWGTTNNPIWAGPDPRGGPAWHHHTTTDFAARHYPGH
jgi:hypothetical protein